MCNAGVFDVVAEGLGPSTSAKCTGQAGAHPACAGHALLLSEYQPGRADNSLAQAAYRCLPGCVDPATLCPCADLYAGSFLLQTRFMQDPGPHQQQQFVVTSILVHLSQLC